MEKDQVNDALAKILEYKSKKELMKKDVRSSYKNPPDREVLLKKLKETGKVDNYEVELISKKEKLKTVLISTTLEGEVISGMMMDITKRKQAEEALAESEKRYRNFVETSSECVCNLDLEGNFMYMSPAGLMMYELSEGGVKGVHCTKLVKPTYSDLLNETLEKAKRGKTVQFQYESETSTGDRWFESILKPIRDDSGKIVSLLRISRDITAGKKAGEKLRESEKNLIDAQQLAHIGHWAWDIKRSILKWSDEIFNIFGVKKDSFVVSAENFEKTIHPEDLEFFLNERKEALDSDKDLSIVHRIIRSNGEVRYVHERATIIRDKHNNPLRVFGTVQDVTERKLVEEALKVSKEKFRNLMETVPIGISMSTPEDSFVEVNKTMVEMFGYDSKEEYLKLNPTTLYHDPKDRERFVDLMKKEGVKDYEIQYKRKDGTLFWGSESSVTQKIDGGIQFINSLQDITERRRSEEGLLNKIEELEKFHQLTVGRELKMIKLEEEIERLKEELKSLRKND